MRGHRQQRACAHILAGQAAVGATGVRAKKSLLAHKVALVFVALVLVCALGAPVAFAEEGPENLVNPQQRPDSSFIYDTSIASLDSADAFYDNQTVQVVGEVVGDSLKQGFDEKHRWITLTALEKEIAATVSVFMRVESADKIDAFGKYGVTGTTLQIRGTFHIVCPEHEGLTDLHAEIVDVVEKGKHHEDKFDINNFVPGAIAMAAGLIIMGLFYFLRERQR